MDRCHDDPLRVVPPPQARTAPLAGRVLCFSPHPDDEVIGPGGTLCLHRRQGDPVHVTVATDGAAGDPTGLYAAGDYVRLRRAETRVALAALDITEVEFWGYPDDCVLTDADVEGIALRAGQSLAAVRPEVVYLPWAGERHLDHRALHHGVLRALARTGFTGTAFGYEVWTPCEADVLIDITPVVDRKRAALQHYATQLRYVDYQHVTFGLHAYRSLMCGAGRGYWEAFVQILTASTDD